MPGVSNAICEEDCSTLSVETDSEREPMTEETRVYVLAEAAELLVLRRLLRQAIPMLRRPKEFSEENRRLLAGTIGLALDGADVELEREGWADE